MGRGKEKQEAEKRSGKREERNRKWKREAGSGKRKREAGREKQEVEKRCAGSDEGRLGNERGH
ncbi:MAG: hypothetical protein HFG93_10875 [Dorea sp.]|nr:hypothetical protein [Dorea sp.]